MKIDPPPLSIPTYPQSVRNDGNKNEKTSSGRELLAPVPRYPVPLATKDDERKSSGDVHLGPIVPDVDVRNMSPREMAELSLDLYANGILNWEEHEMLSFQPELNPAFKDTVGALTGEIAEPDRNRDYLELWEKRLDFERKYNPENQDSLLNTRQIVSVLRRLATPLNVLV